MLNKAGNFSAGMHLNQWMIEHGMNECDGL
jgi:hypothetical protein